ncbi:MAG: hydrogenase maturation nickel metallochaperone HypA [Bacteroidetes bacterium]|nr:MAG: hydrogenase maturation nickel metallochaperone HypA [Bacteroidota bacterium]
MHELSIALNILDIVQEECRRAESSSVAEVVIRVGTLSGVDTEALTTCLHVASRDTLMQDARIRIDRQQGRGWCSGCFTEFEMEDILTLCPGCLQPASELRAGQEMQIDSILVE